MTFKELIEKYQKQFDELTESIREAGQAENLSKVEFLYPRMEQVSDFLDDLKTTNENNNKP